MNSTAARSDARLVELRRHQVYRLNRPSRTGLFGKLRRGLRARLAR